MVMLGLTVTTTVSDNGDDNSTIANIPITALRGALISKAVLLQALGRADEATTISDSLQLMPIPSHPHTISLTTLHQSLFQWEFWQCSACKARGTIPTGLFYCSNCPTEPFFGHQFVICWHCSRTLRAI